MNATALPFEVVIELLKFILRFLKFKEFSFLFKGKQ